MDFQEIDLKSLADWNNKMYREHPTPYEHGFITQVINRCRFKWISKFAEVTERSSIIEVGCESGRLICSFATHGRRVGVDISDAALHDARAFAEQQGLNVQFFQHDAQAVLPFTEGEFDVIVSSEMLEHLPNPRRALETLHALAGPKTRVIVTIPIERPKLIVKSILARIGLLNIMFPGIENGQSNWHLHQFSKFMFVRQIEGLFKIEQEKAIWLNHHIFRLQKIHA